MTQSQISTLMYKRVEVQLTGSDCEADFQTGLTSRHEFL